MTAHQPPGAHGAGPASAPADAAAVRAYDAVVLAGGAARRLGGTDKPGVAVGGRALLDRVLAACAGARTTVVVAEPRPTARPVHWAREEPPGGGPLAALDAGLRRTTAPHVLVLSADLPFLDQPTVRRLLAALRETGADGALLTDAEGRDQPLVAAYRASALRGGLAALTRTPGAGRRTSARAAAPAVHPSAATAAASTGASTSGASTPGASTPGASTPGADAVVPAVPSGTGLAGMPLRRLTDGLDLTRVPDPVASFDCDTWDDIAAARARIREHGHVLDEWISAVKDELGIELDVDTGALLDLARDAAHGVARPAAPLTTFLVGYAAARAQGGPDAVAEAVRKASALAQRWASEAAAEGRPDTAPGAGTDTRPDAG
ncbi:NTP transferase domain-containing protein [Streptomyces sp. MS06]|uniref:NTP transferase domain-containing protein n=1 Tax=Streptomyces sp. MS06 TaxID=3385974 RepID=UPI0039A086B1